MSGFNPTTSGAGGEPIISSFASPFGSGRFSGRQLADRRAFEARQRALGNDQSDAEGASNNPDRVRKWPLHRALVEARARFGLSDRTLSVLAALLSAMPGEELDAGQAQIVFPSNAELSLRTGGMAPATLRRHLAALVATGMIHRHDSPNGKRYCRRDERGLIADAFGFDLAPFADLAETIFQAADHTRREAREKKRLREEITLHGRDMARILDVALEEGRGETFAAFLMRLRPLQKPLRRAATLDELVLHRDACARLHAEIEAAYLASMTLDELNKQEMSANDAENERHKQNSNSDSNLDKGFEKKLKPTAAPEPQAHDDEAADEANEEVGRGQGLKGVSGLPLADILARCPQIADYAEGPIRHRADFVRAAHLARAALGISPDAWAKARDAMGDETAATVIACMLERVDQIRKPGGYLRALTDKAENGQFSVMPMLRALG